MPVANMEDNAVDVKRFLNIGLAILNQGQVYHQRYEILTDLKTLVIVWMGGAPPGQGSFLGVDARH